MGGNLVADAVYPLALTYADGRRSTAPTATSCVSRKIRIPPVNAFWSLIMYDADSYLVDNLLDRYALGDRDPLTFGPDGPLTLYLQSEPPVPGKEDNWLPAPKEGEFKTALRLYAPKEQVGNGTWQPPPITRTSPKPPSRSDCPLLRGHSCRLGRYLTAPIDGDGCGDSTIFRLLRNADATHIVL